MQDDVDIKVWQQERDFWIPRVSVILTSNSLLFLGYVMIFQNWLGLAVSFLAFASNILIAAYLYQYEKRLNSLEKRIRHRLPLEYRDPQKKPPQGIVNRLVRLVGFGIKGRGGYRMVIIIFLILWAVAFYFSWHNQMPFRITGTQEDTCSWNPSKGIIVSFRVSNQDFNSSLRSNETISHLDPSISEPNIIAQHGEIWRDSAEISSDLPARTS